VLELLIPGTHSRFSIFCIYLRRRLNSRNRNNTSILCHARCLLFSFGYESITFLPMNEPGSSTLTNEFRNNPGYYNSESDLPFIFIPYTRPRSGNRVEASSASAASILPRTSDELGLRKYRRVETLYLDLCFGDTRILRRAPNSNL